MEGRITTTVLTGPHPKPKGKPMAPDAEEDTAPGPSLDPDPGHRLNADPVRTTTTEPKIPEAANPAVATILTKRKDWSSNPNPNTNAATKQHHTATP
jgi:hypothetical protein